MNYEDQLERALAETPDVADSENRFEVPDPVVRMEGSRTVWENFETTYTTLARDSDHLMRYLQSELGTSAQIDDKGRARFTGDFRESRVKDAVEAYASEYVYCHECGSPDTQLTNRRGTSMVKCDACGALSSVSEV